MKRLLVMRHAKSSWAAPGLEDRERPLNARGREAARRLGLCFREQGIKIDYAFYSSAVRTRETFELLHQAYARQVPAVALPELYLSTGAGMLEIVKTAPVEAATLLVLAHFPGVQELSLALAAASDEQISDRIARKFPTGAVADIELAIENWSDAVTACGRLRGYILPRQLS